MIPHVLPEREALALVLREGEEDDGNLGERGLSPEKAEHLPPVDIGQEEVEEDGRRAMCPRELDPLMLAP